LGVGDNCQADMLQRKKGMFDSDASEGKMLGREINSRM
jgi:hypothetical protein